MAANLEMISNFLLEKENREKEALRRESADLLAETTSHVLTTLPKESDYIKPEEANGSGEGSMGMSQQINEFNAQKQRNDLNSKQAVESGKPHENVVLEGQVATEPIDGFGVVKREETLLTPQQQRDKYVQGFATWADAEKAGDVSQREWANGQIRKMIAEGKNPGEFINMLSMLGSAETPAEKEKRERREALGETFRGLGNLIGNAANLYNATRGGTPVDLNTANEKHRARMEQIKAKQDALDEKLRETLANAKMNEMAAERAEKAAEKKSESDAKAANLKFQRDVYLKEVDNAFKLGQIDAQTAARLKEAAAKADSDKALKALEYEYRVKLKTTPSASDNKIVDSAMDSNGDFWGKSTKLTSNEKRQIVMSSPYYHREKHNFTDKKTGKVDYERMASWLMAERLVDPSILEKMGMTKIKVDDKFSWEDEEETTNTDW
jgi:hypothetical protein